MARRIDRPPWRWAPLLAGVLLVAGACRPGSPDGAGAGGRAGPDLRLAATLQPFDTCPDVLHWFQEEALRRVGANGLDGQGGTRLQSVGSAVGDSGSTKLSSGPSDTAAPSAYSATNVQEPGVDEPDVVKTDGRRLISVAGDQMHVVDITGAQPVVTGRVTLPGGTAGWRLLIRGDRVLAMTVASSASSASSGGIAMSSSGVVPGAGSGDGDGGPVARLALVDLADPAAPTVTRSIVVDGAVLDARLVGDRVRVVTTTAPRRLPFVYPSNASTAARDTARQANQDAVRRTTIDDWLPHVRPADARPDDRGALLVACESLRHPREFSGLGTIAVLSLDLDRDPLAAVDAVGVVSGAETVYASATTLYVATTMIPDVPAADTAGPTGSAPSGAGAETAPAAPATAAPPATPAAAVGAEPGAPSSAPATVATPAPSRPRPPADARPLPRSAIHAFDIAQAGAAVYRASGLVDGTVAERWSLSEHDGHLRVVSTTGTYGCRGCAGEQTQLTVLAARGGELTPVGQVGDMGRGEMVRAVRFTGDRGYIVTFRQTDPLHVLDLHDPTRPAVTGELEVPGYSAYLHPLDGGRLLGVGQEATGTGRPLGTKIALYDVTDAAHPHEVAHLVLAQTGSEVESDAHAFLWWAPSRLALVPVAPRPTGPAPAAEPPFTGTIGFRVDGSTLAEVGRIPDGAPSGGPRRAVVVGDTLYTVSGTGVRASTLDALTPRGEEVAFPTPPDRGPSSTVR
jgi:hypothetical protein